MGQSGSSRSATPSSPTATTAPSRPRSKTTQARPQQTVDVTATARIKQEDTVVPSSPVFGSPLEDNNFFFSKGSPHNESVDLADEMDKDKFPTVFRWTEGGTNVYVAGSFTNWKKIPLVKR